MASQSVELVKLQDKYGGYWGKGHPVHTTAEWATEARDNNTRQGYWEWLESVLESEEELDDVMRQ